MLDYEVIEDNIEWEPKVGDKVKILDYSYFPISRNRVLNGEYPNRIGIVVIEDITNSLDSRNGVYTVTLAGGRNFKKSELEFIE